MIYIKNCVLKGYYNDQELLSTNGPVKFDIELDLDRGVVYNTVSFYAHPVAILGFLQAVEVERPVVPRKITKKGVLGGLVTWVTPTMRLICHIGPNEKHVYILRHITSIEWTQGVRDGRGHLPPTYVTITCGGFS